MKLTPPQEKRPYIHLVTPADVLRTKELQEEVNEIMVRVAKTPDRWHHDKIGSLYSFGPICVERNLVWMLDRPGRIIKRKGWRIRHRQRGPIFKLLREAKSYVEDHFDTLLKEYEEMDNV